MDERVATLWRDHRRRLLDIGYRILGSVSDAEDAADEAYARLLDTDLDTIDDPEGWLVSVTGRLCIDRLRSAEHRRRAYVGPWLPEPLVSIADGKAVDPADRVTLDESVRMALLVLLEQLSPAERTSFVLHDLFGMPFEEVGGIVGRSPAACRQLASRARRRIQSDPGARRSPTSHSELDDIAKRFAAACAAGTIEPLLEVLDPQVVGDFDSGGTVPGAPVRAVVGAEQVSRILVHSFRDSDFDFAAGLVNGDPGVVVRSDGRIAAVMSFTAGDGSIDVLHGIGNPQKLRHLNEGLADR